MESCERCQRNKKKLQKQAGVLHPIVVEPKIWHQVGMDLIGPLQETPRGNKYIVTLTDYFSKWAEAAALPDKCAVGVAKFIYSVRVIMIIIIIVITFIFYTQVMCHYGCPKVLITDQGREFVNEVSAQLYSITHTEHRITSAYHPQVCILVYLPQLFITIILIIIHADKWFDREVQSNALQISSQNCQ